MNKALLDTDTLSEIRKGSNPAVAANAKTYRRATGNTAHYARIQPLGSPLTLVNWRIQGADWRRREVAQRPGLRRAVDLASCLVT